MEGIPKPEDITSIDLILSANRALLCEIRPNMRKVAVEYLKDQQKILLYYYYNEPPSQKELDYDVVGTISTEMSCDFPFEINFEEYIIVIPYPGILPEKGICVYRRYEPSWDNMEKKGLFSKEGKVCYEEKGKDFKNSDIVQIKEKQGSREITKVDLVIAANQALNCLIHPNMREIDFEYVKEERKINCIVYFDSPPTNAHLADVRNIISRMRNQFPEEIQWEEQIIDLPYPSRIPNRGICMYRRYERSPDIDN